jgi:ribosomal-protein-alanine N-acetyltransferase
MHYTFEPMSEENAHAVLEWRYEPPYSPYNPDPGEFGEWLRLLLDPGNFYYSILNEKGELAGYCCFGNDARVPGGIYDNEDVLDVGLGMRPDLTGQGRGYDFLNAILEFARGEFSPAMFQVTVAAFNERAIHLYGKAGFKPVHTFVNGDGCRALKFIQMVRKET